MLLTRFLEKKSATSGSAAPYSHFGGAFILLEIQTPRVLPADNRVSRLSFLALPVRALTNSTAFFAEIAPAQGPPHRVSHLAPYTRTTIF